MKKTASLLLLLFALPFIALAALSFFSTAPDTGLVNGRLRPCPESPNCVVSEPESSDAYVKPLHYDGIPDDAWKALRNAVTRIGGRIEVDDGAYLRAEFRSAVFRFVDDLECRLDSDNGVIHIRSASRVGYSDLGVNRNRVERLRSEFEASTDERVDSSSG